MATVFWDTKSILLVDDLKKGSAIIAEHCANLLDQSKQKIKEKRPDLAMKNVLFCQDNVTNHKVVKVTEEIHELNLKS